MDVKVLAKFVAARWLSCLAGRPTLISPTRVVEAVVMWRRHVLRVHFVACHLCLAVGR